MSNFKQRVCPKKKKNLFILTFSFFLFLSHFFPLILSPRALHFSTLPYDFSLFLHRLPSCRQTHKACPTPTHPFSKEESSVRRLHRRRERAFQRHQSKPISGTLRFSPKVYLPRSKPMWNFVHWGWVWCSVVCACEILALVVALGLIELVDL